MQRLGSSTSGVESHGMARFIGLQDVTVCYSLFRPFVEVMIYAAAGFFVK